MEAPDLPPTILLTSYNQANQLIADLTLQVEPHIIQRFRATQTNYD
mgnify:CR=1 FL=1